MQTPRLLRSAPLRLALLYVALFGLSVLALLVFLYWSTASYMLRQADDTIEAEIAGLAERYRLTGVAGLSASIRDRLARQPAGPTIYLLVAPNYVPIVGNIRSWPQVEPDAQGWLVFRLAETFGASDVEVHGARARSFRLRGGYHLLVGRDMHELEAIQARMLRAMGWGVLITALLALGGGVLMSRASSRRLSAINAAVAEIMAGDLSRRLPAGDTGDEFGHLVELLNRMLDRIEELIEGIRRVSDNIAHDLRTPLARLRNRLEELDSGGMEEASRRRLVEQAVAEADALLQTFNALLRIARVEAGHRRAGFSTVDLAEVAADVVELYEPLAEERGQTLEGSFATGVTLSGDRDLLFQAVANLVDNALKYSPEGGRIEVRVESGGGSGPRLVVADEGPGIEPAERQKVLQRFYRLEQSRTTPGNGLGLSLVDAVARLHGFELRLEDNEPGLRVSLALLAPGA